MFVRLTNYIHSSDQRNFLVSPPENSDFSFDYGEYHQQALVNSLIPLFNDDLCFLGFVENRCPVAKNEIQSCS